MSFDWSEYLKLAQELAGPSTLHATPEARQRAAIRRAYYAAFCKCRNYLRDEKEHRVPLGGRAHQFVRDEFKKIPTGFKNASAIISKGFAVTAIKRTMTTISP